MWQKLAKMNPKIVVEFRDFLMKTNMFALAMAVVIGVAVGKVVDAIVADLVMPVIGVIFPAGAWQTWTLNIWRLYFPLGHLFANLLNFVIIAGVVFFITKAFMKAPVAAAAASPAVPSKVCPQCMETIHPDAKKCKFCTSPM